MSMPLSGGTVLLDARALLARVALGPGMHVADLGCGATGHYIIPAARIVGADGMAYAVDIQKSALAGTAGRAKLDGASHITYIWSDIERVGATNIPAASLDVAMIVNTLYLTTHPDQAMIEAARLTKPHGRVLVVEWNPETTAVGPEAERRMTPDAVRAAASAAHLTEESMFAAGAYHQGFVFVRTE